MNGSLTSGQNEGAIAWDILHGDTVTLTLDFSYSNLPNGGGLTFNLRGTANAALLGIRVNSDGRGAGGAKLQAMTTGSTSSYAEISGSPTLALDTWYRLTVSLTVVNNTNTTFGVTLNQLGTGGGEILSVTGLALVNGSNFTSVTTPGTAVLTMGVAGVPTYSVADISLTRTRLVDAPVPEPSSVAILLALGSGLGGILLRRKLRATQSA
ncbi:MAG: PEP-CTERM sorting domain-containing protein [Opitutaceae bacterium]|nr:PEP-CTERM sorting domain-containing protein [Opitutaceae bacterium]